MSIGIAVAALLAEHVSGSEKLAGLAQTMQVLGAAVASFLLAHVMGRRGRRTRPRPSATCSAPPGPALCVVAGVVGSFPLLLAGATLLGRRPRPRTTSPATPPPTWRRPRSGPGPSRWWSGRPPSAPSPARTSPASPGRAGRALGRAGADRPVRCSASLGMLVGGRRARRPAAARPAAGRPGGGARPRRVPPARSRRGRGCVRGGPDPAGRRRRRRRARAGARGDDLGDGDDAAAHAPRRRRPSRSSAW